MIVYPFTADTVVHSGIARVTLAGELDMDTSRRVRDAVASCLATRPTSLCLDLTGISFCDCAGLSTLLTARITALEAGADFLVEGLGTPVARLLSLIGADSVFTGRQTPASAGSAHRGTETAATRRDTAAATATSRVRDLLT
ncbi:STAS domain-containing protein [Streptomyces longisporoflavus]|uniref:STAS domain-containing protein n=1 Tax=Streptomyces longisporoflavus TaxID=28044 RepID=UPI00167EC314|nr:STAS domain-containing protein [Streptomyces longisporoflavus]